MAKRRSNGEGSIRKRKDGRWEGRYTAGYHPETGKRIIKNVLGKTQAECKEKLKKAIEDAGVLDVVRSDEYTVGSWATTWYELYSKPYVRPNTARYYKRIIDCYIIPNIGDIKLGKLSARDIQKLYNDLIDHGRVREVQKEKNPGLSSSYVRGLHMMLHNCLDRAVKERLIPRNPTEDCIVPKAQKKEMKILHPDQIGAYLKAAEDYGMLPMFFLELTTGLRKGELVALLWSDLDVENRTLSVSKQAVRGEDGTVTATRPKTETSIRKLPLPQEAVDLLIQEHEKHPDNPYMFPSRSTGGMYNPDSVVNLHSRILKKAGLGHLRFHDLRHTFATLALQNGVDVKTVSSMLGHYDAGFTLSTYAHATARVQEEAARKMGSFISSHTEAAKTTPQNKE